MRVTLRDLTIVLGGRTILEDVTAEFPPGLTSIEGPSGSGKSTLLGSIAGDIPLARGSVEGVGRHRVSWIVQSAPVLPRRSAFDNVVLGPLSVGRDAAGAAADAAVALDRVGLADHAPVLAYRLSGGERQRVAIARELASGLALVLADEPTASLDARSRESVCDALEELADRGTIVLVATHDRYVSERCDGRYLIADRRLVAA